MDNFLKPFKLIFLFCLISILISCGVLNHLGMENDIEKNSIKLMKTIVDEDVEGVFDFFCNDMRDKYADESKKEVKSLFNYIDGKITSYKYKGIHGYEESNKHGNIDYYRCYTKFEIETDKNKKYILRFSYYYIWDKHPEYEGINRITVYAEDGTNVQFRIGRTYNYND